MKPWIKNPQLLQNITLEIRVSSSEFLKIKILSCLKLAPISLDVRLRILPLTSFHGLCFAALAEFVWS